MGCISNLMVDVIANCVVGCEEVVFEVRYVNCALLERGESGV